MFAEFNITRGAMESSSAKLKADSTIVVQQTLWVQRSSGHLENSSEAIPVSMKKAKSHRV